MTTPSLFTSIRTVTQGAASAGRGVALVAALLLALGPLATRGHEGGLELVVSPAEIAAGDEVTVTGEGFAANTGLELRLTGPNGDAPLGYATADGAGAFTQPVRILGDVIPGLYLVRAEGTDEEASAEVTVGAMAGMAAEAEAIAPERDRSAAWRAIAVVLFLGLGVVGLALARPARAGFLARSSA